MTKLDVIDVRRRWLASGLDVAAVAAEMGASRQAIYDAVRRADAQSPLRWNLGAVEDRAAMARYVEWCMDRAHIEHAEIRVTP